MSLARFEGVVSLYFIRLDGCDRIVFCLNYLQFTRFIDCLIVSFGMSIVYSR